MKTNVFFSLVLGTLFLISCQQSQKPKTETLWNEEFLEKNKKDLKIEEKEVRKIQLNVLVSPPPPIEKKIKNIVSSINPEKISTSDKIYTFSEIDFLAYYSKEDWDSYSETIKLLEYPEKAKNCTFNTLNVFFVVEKDGTTSNFKFNVFDKNGSKYEFKLPREENNHISEDIKIISEEIKKFIESNPYWIPAEKDGKYVRSNYVFALFNVDDKK